MLLECLDARRATRGMKGVPDCEAPVALQNKDKVVMSMTIMTLENSEDNTVDPVINDPAINNLLSPTTFFSCTEHFL